MTQRHESRNDAEDVIQTLSAKLAEIVSENPCKCGTWESEHGCPQCDKWVNVVNEAKHALRSETALTAQQEQLERVLDEIEDYLENQQDVVDGSYGEPRPNAAMSLLTDLRWWRPRPAQGRSDAEVVHAAPTEREDKA